MTPLIQNRPLLADVAPLDLGAPGPQLSFLPILTGAILAASLVVLAGVLIAQHSRAWSRAAASDEQGEEYAFARGQYRRRMQTSVLMAVLGVAMFAGLFIADARWFVAYWTGILLLVAWMTVAAMMDAFWTRQHFSRVRQRQQAEAALLRADLKKLQERAKAENSSTEGKEA